MTVLLYAVWLPGRLLTGNSPRWRRFIYSLWARRFCRLLDIEFEVIGAPPSPPFFLVANHTGYVDIPAIRTLVEGVFVAKSEISGWPVAGTIIRNMGNVFIDRAKRRDIPRAGTEIVRRLEAGDGVIVFPEGTSSDGKQVLPFNSSFLEFAAQSRIPVHYASVSYSTRDGDPPPSIAVAWADETPLAEHMARLFALGGFKARISFGDGPVTGSDRKALARELEDAVRRSFAPLD